MLVLIIVLVTTSNGRCKHVAIIAAPLHALPTLTPNYDFSQPCGLGIVLFTLMS